MPKFESCSRNELIGQALRCNNYFIYMNEKEYWEKILNAEGLGEELPPEFPGEKVQLGDGLGRKTGREEKIEDSGKGHSRMCPLNLGQSLEGEVDQPMDNKTAKALEEAEEKDKKSE